MKAKKPRKCSLCKSTEHRADFHGKQRDRALPELPPLDGAAAMRTMLDPLYAVWLVVEGSVGEALANATRKTHEAQQIGFHVNDTLLRALAELELRSRDVDPELITQARKLRHKMDLAVIAYRNVELQITDKLGYPRKA